MEKPNDKSDCSLACLGIQLLSDSHLCSSHWRHLPVRSMAAVERRVWTVWQGREGEISDGGRWWWLRWRGVLGEKGVRFFS